MDIYPSWLPHLFSMDGNWDTKIVELFQIFVYDFETTKPCLESLKVWWDKRVLDGQYPEGFWHITTRDQNGTRTPDFRRCERLPWCSPSIMNCMDPIIKLWDYREGQKTRTYLWLENYDYVIILEKRTLKNGPTIAFLITAFHVDGTRTRSQLTKKYSQRIQLTI